MKLQREHEDIEDALNIVWQKRVDPSVNAVTPTQFLPVLSDTLRRLNIPPPPSEWYFLAFRNFDLDSDGWIGQSDVLDICTQYVDAFVQLNNEKSGGGAGGEGNAADIINKGWPLHNKQTVTDHRSFSQWLKDLCWQAFRWVDPENTGRVNRTQMKTASTFVFNQLQDVTLPTDNWFERAFTNFDTDADGFLTYDEVVEIADQYVDALKRSGIKVQRKGSGNNQASGSSSQSGQPAKDSLDNRLNKAGREILMTIDPQRKHWFNDKQSLQAIKRIFELVPELGRTPSTRWCNGAFTNFDLEKSGWMHIESWCEIIRQYTGQKLGVRPEHFCLDNILNYRDDKSEPSDQKKDQARSVVPTPGHEAQHRDKQRSVRKDGRTSQKGIQEAVVMTQSIITPTYSGKLRVFEDYEFFEKKGEGAFGKVMTVKHIRTGIMRACKSIAMKSKDQQKLVETEIELMKQLDHPNILRLFECYYDGDTSIYLVTELCNGGSLFDRILYHNKQLKRPMSERQSSTYIQQILAALSYCHSMHIIHRDMKPDNVLFVNRKSDSAVKVIDFGLSDFMSKIEAAAKTVKVNKPKAALADGLRKSLNIANDGAEEQALRKVMPKAGTPHYMSPEMHGKAWYDEKTDVFACGIIVYQMLTGIHPFFVPGVDNAASAKQKIIDSKVTYPSDAWNGVSPLGKQITQAMLDPDPEKRLSSKAALQHKWFHSAKKIQTPLRESVVEGIIKFQDYHKMKQATLRLLAKEVDEMAIKNLRDQFFAMDKDGDGILSFEEVMLAADACSIHISRRELEQTMFALNGPTSKSVTTEVGINYRDFIAAMIEKKVTIEKAHLLEIFNRFSDPEEPGFITGKSILASISMAKRMEGRKSIHEEGLAEMELKEIFEHEAIHDGDTKINFEMFCEICYGGIIGESDPKAPGKKE